MALNFRTSEFTMETLGDHIFPGYTADEKWKGWDKPYFTFETALRLAEVITQVELFAFYHASYDEATNTFTFIEEEGDEPETYSSVSVEGIGSLYPIGAGRWQWDEVVWV